MLGKEHKLCSFLHSPVTSFLLGPNILVSTLFSYTLSLCSSLNVKDQVSHPYRTLRGFSSAAEIHNQLQALYGQNITSEGAAKNKCSQWRAKWYASPSKWWYCSKHWRKNLSKAALHNFRTFCKLPQILCTVLYKVIIDGDEFLSRNATGPETWVSFVNAETKQQSKQ
jgi:hypothetical protein